MSSHYPSSPPSIKALALLQASLSGPYPPTKPSSPPLQFDLEVVESKPPTPEQLKTILSYLSSQKASPATLPASTFLSAHPSAPTTSEDPQSIAGVTQLAEKNLNALKWPIVVDWTGGKASIGDVDGVKGILEAIRQKRDGEGKGESKESKGWF